MTSPVSQPESHVWRHAAEIVPLVVAGLLAAAAAGQQLGAPWWLPSAVVAAVSASTITAVAAVSASRVLTGYTAACALLAVCWTVSAALTSPWTPGSLVTLGIAALILGPLYPVTRGYQRRAEEEADRQEREAARYAEARRWPDLLAQLGAKGVTSDGVDDTRAGQTVHLILPASGRVTFNQLKGLADRVEIAARLRHGSVRFEEGSHAGEVLMMISSRDVLSEVVAWPGDLSPLTINSPVRIGLHEDGEECVVRFREVAALLVGLRGSGKSNLLNVFIAQFARCTDTVIFMIDLKGGRAARPWLQPWLDDRTPRPVLDWVATTAAEASLMLDALLRGIQARARSGAGGEKITPSPYLPAVICIMDEMALVFGYGARPADGTKSSALAAKGMELVQIGRSEAVDAIFATQRGTVTMTGNGDLKSQLGLRIGLGVATEADARLIVPDDASVARILARIQHPGAGIVSDKRHRAAPVKFDRIDPDEIYDIAAILGRRRPEPDGLFLQAMGQAYADRWSPARAGDLLASLAPGPTPLPFAQPPAAAEVDWAAYEAELGAGGPGQATADAADRTHPGRARMLGLLREAGVKGGTVDALTKTLEAEGVGVTRQTVHRWLNEEIDAGRVIKAEYRRYKIAQEGRP